MAWRIILALLAGYLAYSLFKKIRKFFHPGVPGSPETRLNEPEVLVQDPSCGTFIPRKEALKMSRDGQDYFFCSEGCLQRFRRSGPR
ncbi:MAG: YHS domain-containing protein [Thermodesulfobacteriota bacterium]